MDVTAETPQNLLPKPGKSAAAPGQLAKQAVAEARAKGIALPKNAQGIAASQIAQGADPASIFAAVVEPPPEEAPALDDNSAPDLETTATGESAAPDPLSAEEAALDLLMGADDSDQ